MFDARKVLAERWRQYRQRRSAALADVLRSADAPSQPIVPFERRAPSTHIVEARA